MRELKTLRDFEIWYLKEVVINKDNRGFCDFQGFVRVTEEITHPTNLISFNTLKEEVINHIRHREQLIKISIEKIGDYEEVVNWDKGAKEGLMTFFNIIEEDLK